MTTTARDAQQLLIRVNTVDYELILNNVHRQPRVVYYSDECLKQYLFRMNQSRYYLLHKIILYEKNDMEVK